MPLLVGDQEERLGNLGMFGLLKQLALGTPEHSYNQEGAEDPCVGQTFLDLGQFDLA
jgi:hypothetical protein